MNKTIPTAVTAKNATAASVAVGLSVGPTQSLRSQSARACLDALPMISDIQMHDSLDRAAQARLQLEAAAAGVRKLEPEDKLGVRMHLSLVSMKLDVFAGHIRTASELALDVSPEQALALNVAPHAVVRDMRVVLNEQAEKLALGEQVNPREFFPALELLASRAIDRTDALVREVDAERSLSRRRESDLAVH